MIVLAGIGQALGLFEGRFGPGGIGARSRARRGKRGQQQRAKAKGEARSSLSPRRVRGSEDYRRDRYSAALLAAASFMSFSASARLPAPSSFFSSLFSTRSFTAWFQ